MKTIEQPTVPIDTYDQQLKVFSHMGTMFIKEIATRRKHDLVTPKPENVRVSGHVYSLRALGVSDLPVFSHNMTELGEALNRITELEGVQDTSTKPTHEERGKQIRDIGSRTLVLIDNEKPTPGMDDSIIGAIRSESVAVFDWSGRPAGYRSAITSPELTRDIALSENDRIHLKLHLIRFAVLSFLFSDDDGPSYNPEEILVNELPNMRHDNWAVSELLGFSKEPTHYSQPVARFKKLRKSPLVPITEYHTFDATDIPEALECATRLK